MPVPRHVRISPREKCDTCELLPGRTSSATHASFSWGEMRHMRVSPQEKCDTCEFLPGRNATRASFPPRRNATGAHFSPGEIHTYRISPREKSQNLGIIMASGATPNNMRFLPGINQISPREKSVHVSCPSQDEAKHVGS
jgi:hypothetical protein